MTNGIRVEAGLGDDLVNIAHDLNTTIWVVGMGGTDTVAGTIGGGSPTRLEYNQYRDAGTFRPYVTVYSPSGGTTNTIRFGDNQYGEFENVSGWSQAHAEFFNMLGTSGDDLFSFRTASWPTKYTIDGAGGSNDRLDVSLATYFWSTSELFYFVKNAGGGSSRIEAWTKEAGTYFYSALPGTFTYSNIETVHMYGTANNDKLQIEHQTYTTGLYFHDGGGTDALYVYLQWGTTLSSSGATWRQYYYGGLLGMIQFDSISSISESYV
jgi:hypothetical protein